MLTHSRLLRWVAATAVLAGAATQVRCGGAAPATAPVVGEVALVSGDLTASDRGDLVVIPLSGGAMNVLGSGVSANSPLAYSSADHAILGVSIAGQTPQISSYRLGERTWTKIIDGRKPLLSNTNRLAFCDPDGRLTVMDLITGAATVVASLWSFSSCTPMAWSQDGRLAFVERTPLGSPGGPGPIALFIRNPDGAMKELPVPEALSLGISAVSWSADGERIALSAPKRQIVVKDANTGETVSSFRGDLARYAPDQDKLAVLHHANLESDASIEVYAGSSLESQRKFGKIRRLGFDWVAGGNAIVVAMDDSIGFWRLRPDNLVTRSVGKKVFANILWIPP